MWTKDIFSKWKYFEGRLLHFMLLNDHKKSFWEI